jgi:hypothetical protein
MYRRFQIEVLIELVALISCKVLMKVPRLAHRITQLIARHLLRLLLDRDLTRVVRFLILSGSQSTHFVTKPHDFGQ